MFADGCMDLVISLGRGTPKINGVDLAGGRAYISGFMASFVTLSYVSDCTFFGVQFKPGGIAHFVENPVIDYSEKVVQFDDSGLNSIVDNDTKLASRIDEFFLSGLRERRPVSTIIETIVQSRGQISIPDLATKFFITYRTLERLFKNQVGLSPKEFISLVRFRNVLDKILDKSRGKRDESFLSIAYDAGYYDHAHLTREVKQFTGLTPSAILGLEENKRQFLTDFLTYAE